MNEQLRFRKALEGKGRADQVAFCRQRTVGGSEDLTLDERGRLRNLKRPAVTEAPQGQAVYGHKIPGWSEVTAPGSWASSVVAAAKVVANTHRRDRKGQLAQQADGAC